MSRMHALVIGSLFFLLTAANSQAQLYNLPFKAEDFDEGNLKVYWHRPTHGGGVQEHGYDLGGVRYDSQAKKWTEKTVSDAEYNKNKRNDRWVLYGKPIHAMRDGKVIACWRNAPENPPGEYHPKIDEGFIYGGGNGFWIEHADGTRAEYAHMIPGSVPASLCPNNAALLPKKIASPTVENAWPQIRVPAAQQVTIKQGQFLGRVGNSGTSSNTHFHCHVEQGGKAGETKSGGSPVKINFRRGLSAPRQDGDPNNDWKSFAGKPIPPGPVLIWPPRSLVGEYARHGFPAGEFQELFDHLSDSGYRAVWIDTYNVGGKNFINHVWQPAQGLWRAHHLVSSQTHQANTEDADRDGYSPAFVESSVSGGQVRYTAVFVKGKPSDIIMRHGLTTQQHEAEMAAAKKRNLSPVSISVVSVGGERRYTVLYRPEKVGVWEIRSQLTEAGYQAAYNESKKAGRLPIYLNAYMHDGQPYISAIFASKPTGLRKDRHLMSAKTYQEEWAGALQAGMRTHAVTSFDGAQSQHRFAATWWK